MATTNVGITGVGQVMVPVVDVNRATAFYRDTLGLPFLFAAGNLAFVDGGGFRIMLDVAEDDRFRPPGSVLYYKVPDISAATAALKAQGVNFESDPHLIAKMGDHDLWMAFFNDTEGNVLAMMSEVRPPAP